MNESLKQLASEMHETCESLIGNRVLVSKSALTGGTGEGGVVGTLIGYDRDSMQATVQIDEQVALGGCWTAYVGTETVRRSAVQSV